MTKQRSPRTAIDSDMALIIPAHNEAAYIGACLDALTAQNESAGTMDVIVSANNCTDETVAITRGFAPIFEARGSRLRVLDAPDPGKLAALNRAEAECPDGIRIYLDADVICDPALIGQVRAALKPSRPLYATGTLAVAPAESAVTRAYARIWQEMPFVKGGAVGAGFFAVNAAGRALWGDFPDIISDDTFVRLHFAPEDRIEVPARYHWPMVEGFGALVKVRRRQDAGVQELRTRFPDLFANDSVAPIGKTGALRLALRRPLAFAIYLSVHLAVRTKRADETWVRGR